MADSNPAENRGLAEGTKLEYQALRAEVLLRLQLSVQLFAAVMAANGVVMTIGFNSKSAVAFAVAALLDVIVLYYLVEQQERIMFRINSYIRCFLESRETGLLWETRSKRQRAFLSQSPHFLGRSMQYTFAILLLWTNSAFSGYYTGYPGKAIPLAVLTSGLITLHVRRLINQYRRDWGARFDQSWLQIKAEEESGPPDPTA